MEAAAPFGPVARSPSFIAAIILLLFMSSSASSPLAPGVGPAEDRLDARSQTIDSLTFVLSPNRVYVDEPITFYVNATTDSPSATITVTIYFDYLLPDGSTVNPESPVYSESVTGPSANIVAVHSYDRIGNLTDPTGTYFQVRAEVSDGESLAADSRPVYVVQNTPPSLLRKPPSSLFPTNNVPLNMSYVVKDWDNERVLVTWDFGDGTEPAVNETIANPTGSYVWQNHTWSVIPEPGREEYKVYFNMSVSFADDFGHVMYSNHSVTITIGRNTEPWVSFTSASTSWSPGYELPFFAQAIDPEGDPLTWTFVLNDTVEDYLTEVYHTDATDPGASVWQNVTYAFDEVGVYTVTLYVSDALEPYQVKAHNLSQTLRITVAANREPGVLANITMEPVSPRINSTLGYVEVVFSIQAYDPDGDVLYLQWDFGDGERAGNESLGGISVQTFVQVHRYSVAGEYNVSVVVDDNRGHKVLKYKVFYVLTDNAPPMLRYVYFQMSNGVFAAPGTTVNVTVTLFDRERDPVTLWIDFGDNSSVARFDLSEFSEEGTVTVIVPHVYNATGTYTVNITFTDWQFGPSHNVTVQLPLEVKVPRNVGLRYWDWWDYTSLGMIVVSFILILARWSYLGRFRKDLDKRGLTLEEYRTIVAELKTDRDEALKRIDAQVRESRLDPAKAEAMKAQVRDGYAESKKALRTGTAAEAETGV